MKLQIKAFPFTWERNRMGSYVLHNGQVFRISERCSEENPTGESELRIFRNQTNMKVPAKSLQSLYFCSDEEPETDCVLVNNRTVGEHMKMSARTYTEKDSKSVKELQNDGWYRIIGPVRDAEYHMVIKNNLINSYVTAVGNNSDNLGIAVYETEDAWSKRRHDLFNILMESKSLPDFIERVQIAYSNDLLVNT